MFIWCTRQCTKDVLRDPEWLICLGHIKILKMKNNFTTPEEYRTNNPKKQI